MDRNAGPACSGTVARHQPEYAVIADAIRYRLQHAALIITITGESYRGVKA
jgi:hypothetical protein